MCMARARTTSDIFNAIAEPQRRSILTLLKHGEYTVNDIAIRLDMRQPQASKHLRVLREVDLVRVRRAGKQRHYRLIAKNLKPIYEWTGGFEQLWRDRFEQLDEHLEQMKLENTDDD